MKIRTFAAVLFAVMAGALSAAANAYVISVSGPSSGTVGDVAFEVVVTREAQEIPLTSVQFDLNYDESRLSFEAASAGSLNPDSDWIFIANETALGSVLVATFDATLAGAPVPLSGSIATLDFTLLSSADITTTLALSGIIGDYFDDEGNQITPNFPTQILYEFTINQTTSVPIPSTLLLCALGFALLGGTAARAGGKRASASRH